MADIVMIPIDHLHPHPLNPRKDLGDLTELAESIKAKGILQNLTVIPIALVDPDASASLGNDHYTVLIGHRRHAAAKLAGLTELPCAIVEMDEKEQVQTMLIENIQRTDLTVYEQAQGFQMMLDLGATIEEISEKSGFSETTVRRRVKMMELDQQKLKEVSARQLSLMDFDRLAQITDIVARNECLDKIGTNDFDMAVQKAIKYQLIKENTPAVKAWLKSVKAKSIEGNARWNGKYDRIGTTIYVDKWGEDGNKPKDGIEAKPVFYYLGKKGEYGYGQLELYHEREKAAPVKRPPEEIEKEKAVHAAWQKLESAASNAYDLRKKFVENLSVTKKNELEVMRGAVFAGALSSIMYNSSDQAGLMQAIGMEPSSFYSEREPRFRECFEKVSGDAWAKVVYALFGDDAKQTCTASTFKKEYPKYEKKLKLELIYRWLCSLGYETSTEEAQILTGEHEAFKAGEDNGEV